MRYTLRQQVELSKALGLRLDCTNAAKRYSQQEQGFLMSTVFLAGDTEAIPAPALKALRAAVAELTEAEQLKLIRFNTWLLQ